MDNLASFSNNSEKFSFFSVVFEAGYHFVAQGSLKLRILLSQLLEGCNYRCVPPCPGRDLVFCMQICTEGQLPYCNRYNTHTHTHRFRVTDSVGGETQTVRARDLANGKEVREEKGNWKRREKRKRKRKGGRKRRKVRETAAKSIEKHCRGLGTLVIFGQ